jgi:hypothetical protein
VQAYERVSRTTRHQHPLTTAYAKLCWGRNVCLDCAHLPGKHTCCRGVSACARGPVVAAAAANLPVSSTIFALPSTVCAARPIATSRGRPAAANSKQIQAADTCENTVPSALAQACDLARPHARALQHAQLCAWPCAARWRAPNTTNTPIHTCAHAPVCQCLNHEVHVCWSAAAEACDC